MFSRELIDLSSPLIEMDNIVLIPHIAGYTHGAMIKKNICVAEIILDFIEEK